MKLGTDFGGFCVLCMDITLLKLQNHCHGAHGLYHPDCRPQVSSGKYYYQWLRIRLPMQGAWVRSLVREDPT